MNYDPNAKFGDEVEIRLVFGQWEYRKEFTVKVKANLRGVDAIETAIEHVYKDSAAGDDFAVITLDGPDDDTLECDEAQDGFERGYGDVEWLKKMLVSAEITNLKLAK